MTKDYSLILRRYWGYDDFRGIQREIIESISSGHDTLGLMPTGGGKSITFQVPALAQEGVCIVITPLIALMKDQVAHLRQRSIKAEAIHSGLSHDDILRILENAVFGAVKLLYVSPERIASDIFRQKLRHMKVSFICVDEAHCISQWGYDFRPSYLAIADIRKLVPQAPILALTATATPAVVDDIQQQLAFREKRVFTMSFERKNLAYVVRRADNKTAELIHILRHVAGSAIVYTRSRQHSRDYAKTLTDAGFSATFFHAGLADAEKDARQKDWQNDQTRIIVATNAFGMGIDKPNVRIVVHVDCPDSIEAYFQEAGRAGRDGQKAYAVLLYNTSDKTKLTNAVGSTFPPKEYIRQVYDQLAYFFQVGVGSGYNATFEFPQDKFCRVYSHFPQRLKSALKILDRAGYIEYREEEENQARLRFILERDDLYRLRGNSPDEDRVIVALLRLYSGLFVDYCYIDETLLSMHTGLTRTIVYATLKSLNQKHIVSFIPQKRTPYIRYRQRREDSEHLIISPAVYDDLKERYVQRVNKMVEYANNAKRCRSRMLLSYFGQKGTKDCGQCDVCLSDTGRRDIRKKMADAQQCILQLLADGQPHHASVLEQTGLLPEVIDAALDTLIEEDIETDDDGMLSLGT